MLQQQTWQPKIGLQDGCLLHLMRNVYLLDQRIEVCERCFFICLIMPAIISAQNG